MAEICHGIVNETKTSATCKSSSRASRRRRIEIRRVKLVAGVAVLQPEKGRKRQKLEVDTDTSPLECEDAVDNSATFDSMQNRLEPENQASRMSENQNSNRSTVQTTLDLTASTSAAPVDPEFFDVYPKFGMTSVCGRRRQMEDAVAIHPSFCRKDRQIQTGLHFYGVYDGHGCSHVAMTCKDRLHELVKEELENREASTEWKESIERSFSRMDTEVLSWRNGNPISDCKCDLQTSQSDAVGSTAVVSIVTPDDIIVSNCGDSRAVLCRNGKAVPLSSDHKPDRPDELQRIQAEGGRVIYWNGARVLGVLATSRAIGDNYLKPYVTSVPEVSITERTAEDECLILASDGLWDVVSNDAACAVARMCLRRQVASPPPGSVVGVAGERFDRACYDASMLLAKLALAKHSTDNVSVVVIDLRRDT